MVGPQTASLACRLEGVEPANQQPVLLCHVVLLVTSLSHCVSRGGGAYSCHVVSAVWWLVLKPHSIGTFFPQVLLTV